MNSQITPGDNIGFTYDNEMDMDIGQKGKEEQTPVSAGTRGVTEREEEARTPPGPSSSKTKYRTRSSGGSAPRAPSRASDAVAELTAGRKSRREAARNANRIAALADADDEEEGDEQQTPKIVDADESKEGPKDMEREKPPLKRRKAKVEGGEEPSSSEETKEKRGRPRITGLYVGRGDAIERVNRLKREALELDVEKSIRGLSASEIRASHKSSVNDKLEELENAPTENVAQLTMQSMVEVWKVASTSKNLKGGYIKALKQAAAVGTASAEVLSHRAGNNEPDDVTRRQLKALRRELEQTKREVQSAKEETNRTKKEMEKLRKELEEARGRGGTRRGVRAVIEDSPPTSPPAN